MVTAVETLRQAALIADATSTRQREAADRRLLVLREVLGIVRAVYEPSHALERDVAKLSAGIDATIALLSKPLKRLPPTLEAAALAVRAGLREIREAARDLDATIARAARRKTTRCRKRRSWRAFCGCGRISTGGTLWCARSCNPACWRCGISPRRRATLRPAVARSDRRSVRVDRDDGGTMASMLAAVTRAAAIGGNCRWRRRRAA